jgi:hypothetical protein
VSATNRSRAIVLESYQTPPALAQAILGWLNPWYPVRGAFLEPSAGAGAFLEAAAVAGFTERYAAEIDPTREERLSTLARQVWIGDFLSLDPQIPNLTHIVGNPPYPRQLLDVAGNPRIGTKGQTLNEDAVGYHVDHAMRLLPVGGVLAFLLRHDWAAPGSRDDVFTDWPLRFLWPITPRPSFVAGTTDSAAYGVYVWERGWTGPTVWERKRWR